MSRSPGLLLTSCLLPGNSFWDLSWLSEKVRKSLGREGGGKSPFLTRVKFQRKKIISGDWRQNKSLVPKAKFTIFWSFFIIQILSFVPLYQVCLVTMDYYFSVIRWIIHFCISLLFQFCTLSFRHHILQVTTMYLKIEVDIEKLLRMCYDILPTLPSLFYLIAYFKLPFDDGIVCFYFEKWTGSTWKFPVKLLLFTIVKGIDDIRRSRPMRSEEPRLGLWRHTAVGVVWCRFVQVAPKWRETFWELLQAIRSHFKS